MTTVRPSPPCRPDTARPSRSTERPWRCATVSASATGEPSTSARRRRRRRTRSASATAADTARLWTATAPRWTATARPSRATPRPTTLTVLLRQDIRQPRQQGQGQGQGLRLQRLPHLRLRRPGRELRGARLQPALPRPALLQQENLRRPQEQGQGQAALHLPLQALVPTSLYTLPLLVLLPL